MKELHVMVVFGLGLLAIFLIGIILSTWVQELVRKKVRNGKGDMRKEDRGWPSAMLCALLDLNAKLEKFDHTINHSLSPRIDELNVSIRKLKQDGQAGDSVGRRDEGGAMW